MRVLIVHYRYFISGGPERYLFNVKRLLEERGHEVIVFSVAYRQNEDSEWAPYFVPPIAGDDEVYFDQHTWTPHTAIRALKATFYSPEAHRVLLRLLQDSQPDVALVMQFQRKMSPSVLTALRRRGVPMVVRLSDYAMVCPAVTLTRNGKPCFECVGRLPLASVRHACVKGSHLASTVEFLATAYHRASHFYDLPDAFLAPTSFMRDMMVQGGLPGERVRVIPTPVSLPPPSNPTARDAFVYLGRLSPEKGVHTLIEAYGLLVGRCDRRVPVLALLGDANRSHGLSLKAHVVELGLDERIVFAGMQDSEGVGRWLARAIATVVPSVWFDNLPNSMLESLAAGVPVIVSDYPTFREALDGHEAGIFVTPGDADGLARAMGQMLCDPKRARAAGRNARRLAEERFSEEGHVAALLDLFGELALTGAGTTTARGNSNPRKP